MYLEIDEGFLGHRKTLRFCALMQNPEAPTFLLRLWTWACRSAPDGELAGMEPYDIEIAVGYRHLDGKCYRALVTAGFLDEADGAPARIHNWMDRTGGAIRRMEDEADRKKRYRDHKARRCGGAAECELCAEEVSKRAPAPVRATSTDGFQDEERTVVSRVRGLSADAAVDKPTQTSPVQSSPVQSSPDKRDPDPEGEHAAGAAPPLALVPVVPAPPAPKFSKPRPAVPSNAHRHLLDAFGSAWAERYGTAYTPTPADRSNLGRLLGMFPSAEAATAELPGLFARYLADADRFYAERRHPLVLFVTQGLVNKYRARASPLEAFTDRERRGVTATQVWLEMHGEATDATR